METVSSIYLEGMGNMVRKPSRMRLTFHYTYPNPEGDIIYTNRDIVKVTEKKTAHLIAGELPSIELEMELVNLDGSFNPNDISGLHDLIVKGVPVTYEFGYDIPNLQYYGYTDGGEHDYGMEENVPYGFTEGYATEWIPGGEVFTSGEISYSKTTATISAKDYLSFLDEHVLLAYGNRTLAQVAKDVLSLTDYPKEDDGDPKIITGTELDAFNTAITLSETEDDSISAKEHLQTIAHACGVQMYIDRGGYIHLDNDKRGISAVYSLPLGQQGEAPEHRKEQMPKKVVITLNSEYGDPVETDLNGGGETMTVENPFIVTTAEGETLSEIVYDHFIKYRNTADVPYRGEPALDILDTISLGTEFGGDVEAIVVGTELQFDGTLSGSLSVRYQLGGNTPEKVQIKGSGNFIYPLGEEDEPSITSFDLVCETTFPTPTYQWSYFTVSNGSWLNIAGATSNTLSVAYNSSYYNNDSSVKFRCVVNDTKGAITQISKIQLQKSETSGYRGAVVATTPANIDVPSAEVGDVVLMDNTTDGTAEVYGEAYIYNGDEWVSTESSDALAMTYKDALQLAEDSGKTIYASEIYADLIVTKRLRVESGNFLTKINETDGVDVTYDGNKLFKVEPLTGKIYFGENFWYDPSDGAIHTPEDNTLIRANGTLKAYFAELLGTLRTGINAPTDARVAIQDEAGITSGPTFIGSGLNDLIITESGAVAGKFRVKIETGYPKYAVGSTGPGGGIVVSNDGITGLEVAPSSTAWSGKTQAESASLANALVYGGQSDWRLPVRGESLTLYNQQSLLIDPYTEIKVYWTSTAYDSSQYYSVAIGGKSDGFGGYGPPNAFSRKPKASPSDARAVRTFTVSADTFRVSIDDGTTYGEVITIPLSGNYSIPSKDITIKFGSVSGHTAGDYWSFEQGAMRGLAITDSAGDEYFSASSGVVNVKETLLLSGIPTSATGLSSGSVWRDGTTLKIV